MAFDFILDPAKISKLLAMAGIFEKRQHTNDDGELETLFTYSVITVDAHDKFAWLHHRMPAILGKNKFRYLQKFEVVIVTNSPC